MPKMVLWPDKPLALHSYNFTDMILGCLLSIFTKTNFRVCHPWWKKMNFTFFIEKALKKTMAQWSRYRSSKLKFNNLNLDLVDFSFLFFFPPFFLFFFPPFFSSYPTSFFFPPILPSFYNIHHLATFFFNFPGTQM